MHIQCKCDYVECKISDNTQPQSVLVNAFALYNNESVIYYLSILFIVSLISAVHPNLGCNILLDIVQD